MHPADEEIFQDPFNFGHTDNICDSEKRLFERDNDARPTKVVSMINTTTPAVNNS